MLVNLNSYAQQSIELSFAGLKKFGIKTATNRIVNIFYNSAITSLINEEPDESIKYNTQGISGIKITRAIRTKLTATKNEYYIIDFDEGASDDPTFVIYKEEDNKLQYIHHLSGTSLVIPGDGNLYVSGHTNNMFDQRKKFMIEKDKITEVSQPFYYVGIESKVKKGLNIYSTTQQHEIVAILPEGSPVTVLLNKGDLYLLKTPQGLVGWVLIPDGDQDTPIEGLYFVGD